jgi:molybdopterin converting factor small subunit
MKVKAKCFPLLSDNDSCNFLDATPYEITSGGKVADLVDRLGFPPENVSRVFINGNKADLATPLADDDRVGFFPSLPKK